MNPSIYFLSLDYLWKKVKESFFLSDSPSFTRSLMLLYCASTVARSSFISSSAFKNHNSHNIIQVHKPCNKISKHCLLNKSSHWTITMDLIPKQFWNDNLWPAHSLSKARQGRVNDVVEWCSTSLFVVQKSSCMTIQGKSADI